MKLLGICLGMVFVLSSCTYLSPAKIPDLKSEKTLRPDVRDQIKYRLQWMGVEQPWHANCLFSKPVSNLIDGEQYLALPAADLLFRAYWEDHRLAYQSAGFLYRQAADAGIPLAFTKLGTLLLDGHGVPRNSEGGAKLMYQAAQLNCAEGQYLYADVLSRGVGVKTDLIKAWGWSEMARLQDHPEGAKLQKRIESVLGASELELAKENAKTLRSQLDLFNHGEEGKQLVSCVTSRAPRPFVTHMRACSVMSGTYTLYKGSVPTYMKE